MTTKDEALKLALEWLEYIDQQDNDRDFLGPEECCALDDTRNTIREALAEQSAQQEEPEQSEIFCGVDFADGLLSVSVLRRRADDVAELLHLEQVTLPAQQKEPFGYFRYDLRLDAWVQNREGRPGTPFYTSPQPSKPLTDEQILSLVIEADDLGKGHIGLARAIEAAHGIKEKNT